jgi:bacterioferritin (cytochrome b1)
MAEPKPAANENEISRDRLAELLNEDLSREYQAIIAYVVYSQVLSGAEYMDIAAQLEIHAKQELDHALIISRQIDYLGKMPAVTPKPVRTSKNPKDMLRYDLDNENETIRNYRDRIRQCEALGEFAMAEQIRQILMQEQDHQIDLATALGIEVPDVSGDKVTYTKLDLPTGQWPYNVAVAPSGKIALTADNGGAGSSDGSVDTVSVVDLELNPIRITDRIVVGDGPEGLAISPKGDVAVAVILAGSNNKSAYFYKRNGSIAVLRIDGKKVTKVGDIELGGLPEGAAFTPDGKYLFVGNYLDQDISILKVNGTEIADIGKRFELPGHPASVRMSTH